MLLKKPWGIFCSITTILLLTVWTSIAKLYFIAAVLASIFILIIYLDWPLPLRKILGKILLLIIGKIKLIKGRITKLI
jgi:hypothetical protein